MKVSIIVINWNGEDKLRRFLPEILKVKGVDEFIVTDDASSDKSVEMIERNFPEIKLVKRVQNEGFSSNANSGVKEAKGDLVFLLNPDAIPQPDCVEKSLIYFKDQEVFSIGCNTGGNWSWAKFENGFFWHYMAHGTVQTHQTLWARGGSGIFRKKVFEELGGMDEIMNPYYEEDMDLGYRAVKRGYKNLWVKECLVRLPEEKGVIEANIPKLKFSKIAERNQLIFIWKNITDPKFVWEHIFNLLKHLILHPGYFKIFFAAAVKLPAIINKRSVEVSRAKLTDREIFTKYRV
ncbi:MAG: Glycosyl transferase, family 2 [Candidatus Daviesbacteria bacterium GW2011_GWA2_38_24]|uniref:Glycosyl transferase, family 2 n=1 Tax=Candidatus Daviesbacteria bacterium GW2011_GWA2_38_24 TaxID=1618422 RepID=A0A0G0MQJ8_9BACT|nr:MAG: Glycosyl transferase, family 2 [Candidatus Daviesbacteria bacterium GW2011_GWA2_38_24]KKQ80514.1 MAG: Glycosyl transferase, family 2 [Candidatus Daviesbacteria bacterium GW2011_GWA1_38_7]OGE23305.1 MAG: hypothetical protein A2688_04335 [Candidatus Daviesbacteria bacterium RIFCSPHIGHO2_01_FULL_38_8]